VNLAVVALRYSPDTTSNLRTGWPGRAVEATGATVNESNVVKRVCLCHDVSNKRRPFVHYPYDLGSLRRGRREQPSRLHPETRIPPGGRRDNYVGTASNEAITAV